MEKLVSGSGIKTYQGKNRFSTYRPSAQLFRNDDLFDQLVKDEEKKQPLLVTKRNVNDGAFRSTKSYQPNVPAAEVQQSHKRSLAVLKPIYNVKGVDRGSFASKVVNSHLKQKRKYGSVIRHGKENSKCNSRLYASDDSNEELLGLSVYELSFNRRPLKLYNERRKPLRKVKSKSKFRHPSSAREDICNLNKNNSLSQSDIESSSNRCGDADDKNCIEIDAFQKLSKPQETFFKKPVTFVERSSDLFYKHTVKSNNGSTKTRKKLPFLDENYSVGSAGSNHSFERENSSQNGEISGIERNSKHLYDNHSFIFHEEKKSNNVYLDSSVANHEKSFNPAVVSTPNFNRNEFSKCLQNSSPISTPDGSVTKKPFEAKSQISRNDFCSFEILNHSLPHILETDSTSKKCSCQSFDSHITEKKTSFENSIVAKEELANTQNVSFSRISNADISLIKSSRLMKDEAEENDREVSSSDDLHFLDLKSIFDSPVNKETVKTFSGNSSTHSDDTEYETCCGSRNEARTLSSYSESDNDDVDARTSQETSETDDLTNSLRCFKLSNLDLDEISYDSQIINLQNATEYRYEQRESSSCSNDEICISSMISSSLLSLPDTENTSHSTSNCSEDFKHSLSEKYNEDETTCSFKENEDDIETTSSTPSKISNETKTDIDDEISAIMKPTDGGVDVSSDPKNFTPKKGNNDEEKLRESESARKDSLSLFDKTREMENDFSALSISSKMNVDSQNIELADQTSYSDIEQQGSPILDLTSTADFIGWPESDSEKALKLKNAFENEYEKLAAEQSLEPAPLLVNPEESFCNVNDFSSRLQFVTTRRKKKYALPTLNEEETEEKENAEAFSSTRNSLLPVQPSLYQSSFYNSQFFEKSSMMRHSIVLNAGKKWRRSFITLKNIKDYGLQMENVNEDCKGRGWKKTVQNLICSQPSENHPLREIEECSTIRTGCNEAIISSVCDSFSVISDFVEKCNRPNRARFSLCVNTKPADESGASVTSSESSRLFSDKSFVSFVNDSCESKFGDFELKAGDYSRTCNLSLERYDIRNHFFAKEVVLRHCKQNEPLPFEECFNDRELRNCKKIGEGVYGEVFMLKRSRTHCSVLKIIPIEGDLLINGERQKKFEEIVSELIITSKLSDLRKRKDFYTDNFAELQRCWCVYGKYPQRLIDLWNEYDISKGSDNDSPKIFKSNQLYIVLELSHAGEDLESFVFNNAQQALSVFTQVTNALAVAEEAFMFEHRDLHWGNVLVSKCKTKETQFIIRDRRNIVKLHGVKVTIIDYTLSRISVDNCVVYNDIGQDPDLFTAEGDFQFEIYRLMKDAVRNVWDRYVPKTNIFWLHYLLDKMIKEVRYRRNNTKIHLSNLQLIEDFFKSVVNFDSSYQLCCNAFFR